MFKCGGGKACVSLHETNVRTLDWLICTAFAPTSKHGRALPDCPTIRKELERKGLVARAPGGGGFRARAVELGEAREALLAQTAVLGK